MNGPDKIPEIPQHPEMPDGWDAEQNGEFLGPKSTPGSKCSYMILKPGELPRSCRQAGNYLWEGKTYCKHHNPYVQMTWDAIKFHERIYDVYFYTEMSRKEYARTLDLERKLAEEIDRNAKYERDCVKQIDWLRSQVERLTAYLERLGHQVGRPM